LGNAWFAVPASRVGRPVRRDRAKDPNGANATKADAPPGGENGEPLHREIKEGRRVNTPFNKCFSPPFEFCFMFFFDVAWSRRSVLRADADIASAVTWNPASNKGAVRYGKQSRTQSAASADDRPRTARIRNRRKDYVFRFHQSGKTDPRMFPDSVSRGPR
jgi:hypothetical protein